MTSCIICSRTVYIKQKGMKRAPDIPSTSNPSQRPPPSSRTLFGEAMPTCIKLMVCIGLEDSIFRSLAHNYCPAPLFGLGALYKCVHTIQYKFSVSSISVITTYLSQGLSTVGLRCINMMTPRHVTR